jgi:hypothetical protein
MKNCPSVWDILEHSSGCMQQEREIKPLKKDKETEKFITSNNVNS